MEKTIKKSKTIPIPISESNALVRLYKLYLHMSRNGNGNTNLLINGNVLMSVFEPLKPLEKDSLKKHLISMGQSETDEFTQGRLLGSAMIIFDSPSSIKILEYAKTLAANIKKIILSRNLYRLWDFVKPNDDDDEGFIKRYLITNFCITYASLYFRKKYSWNILNSIIKGTSISPSEQFGGTIEETLTVYKNVLHDNALKLFDLMNEEITINIFDITNLATLLARIQDSACRFLEMIFRITEGYGLSNQIFFNVEKYAIPQTEPRTLIIRQEEIEPLGILHFEELTFEEKKEKKKESPLEEIKYEVSKGEGEIEGEEEVLKKDREKQRQRQKQRYGKAKLNEDLDDSLPHPDEIMIISI